MNNHEFMIAARKKAKECWDKLCKANNKDWDIPPIYFDLNSKSIAGMAYASGHIRLNLAFVKNDAKAMIEQTIPHELVHCFLYKERDPSHVGFSFSFGRTRRNPHGHKFMNLLAFLGCEQRRTHNMKIDENFQGRKQRVWKYKCSCRTHSLSTVVHNKIVRGNRRRCLRCGDIITSANRVL